MMDRARKLLAGVELGGTKCICILGTGPDDVRAQRAIPTTDPATTLSGIERTLRDMFETHGQPQSLGIGSFGPVDLDVASPRYGFITSTPKPGWRDTNVALRLRDATGVPVSFDTDVNAAALAEGRWGAARGLDDFAYVTVGTGIGVGLVVNGATVKGFGHPEAGHIRIKRRTGDVWAGNCPFHGDCLEGLASGSAIAARSGRLGSEIAADDPVWDDVAHALAQLCATLALTTAPKRILFGGGVMNAQAHLYPRIREAFRTSLSGYVDVPAVMEHLDDYIRPAGLGDRAGPLGALAVRPD